MAASEVTYWKHAYCQTILTPAFISVFLIPLTDAQHPDERFWALPEAHQAQREPRDPHHVYQMEQGFWWHNSFLNCTFNSADVNKTKRVKTLQNSLDFTSILYKSYHFNIKVGYVFIAGEIGVTSLYVTLQNSPSHYLKVHHLFFRMSSNIAMVLSSKGGAFFSKPFIALLLPDVLFDGIEPLIVCRKDW